MHGSDTFSYTGYADLYRISGDTSESLLSASYDIVTGATPSFDNDVTGTSASSILLLMSISASTSATLTASGYAVTTDNPTFTEITDTTQGSGGGQRVGIHTAYSNTRTSTNSTGNSTISLANGSSGTTSYCVLVSIGNPENVTITIDSAGILNTSMPEPSFILDNNISIDTPGTLTLSSADMIITTSENTVWNYEEKPNTTWTNEQQ
jgi:hypothetical protein